ncbi:tyrosine-protein phosphatase [Streptomyces sp. AP-93]|uniref:tyrosine-protein phosphatase n=1 Tax=Streptomyces sp. AP-93 TaxID=2929048 RepID=UPI001FAF635F|nr:tyrosine-protein phosphatase [Streptomyces sp. AP-93]MCJ0868076.1 tyrosine-protein phosphatase [Streptomyces sp. AP-93]
MRSIRRALSASAVALALAAPLVPVAAHAATINYSWSSSTTSSSRVLTVPGLVNARDVGGYTTYDGKSTRWGVVYRSETLSKLPADGVTALAGLGLGDVIDLRMSAERQADGLDKLPAGVNSVSLPVDDTNLFAFIGQVVRSKDPVYQQAQLGNGAAEARMIALYKGFVTNSANRTALGNAVKNVANSTKPVMFHCSSGKDRTGVLADTILRSVGVPASTSEQDYLLSNSLRAASDKALRDQVKAGGYMQNPDLLIPLQEVRSPYLAAFRDQAVADYGSFGNFLTNGLGLSASDLVKLRSRVVA